MWEPVKKNDITFWQVKAWQQYPWLIHGFTTRTVGNLALHTGEEPTIIIENRTRISEALGVELANWVTANQVHGTSIEYVTLTHQGQGATNQDSAIANNDGLITDQAGIMLASFYADCVPLLFIEPKREIVAMAHAGWRGTAQQIGVKMLKYFDNKFGIKPSAIQVAIGPSIGPCCYQIGEELAEEFDQEVVSSKGDSFYLDLWRANKKQLLSAGIIAEQLFMAGICTLCNQQEFFSYRHEQSQAGRMAALLYRKP